jgi:hypothetical protein
MLVRMLEVLSRTLGIVDRTADEVEGMLARTEGEFVAPRAVRGLYGTKGVQSCAWLAKCVTCTCVIVRCMATAR